VPCNTGESCVALAFLQGKLRGIASSNIPRNSSTLRTLPFIVCSETIIGLFGFILPASYGGRHGLAHFVLLKPDKVRSVAR
jgi:hypothetical protein